MPELLIALDVGGTKLAGAVIDAGGSIVRRVRMPTNAQAGAEALIAAMITMSADLREQEPAVRAIGVASAGQIDCGTGRVIYANENLPGWTGMAIREHLQDALGLPVSVENDVNAMAVGEAVRGAGAGRRVVLVVAVGTGIGGALVLDGSLFRGATGVAGELGHIPLTTDGPRCACGNRGCLEAYAAGPRITAAYLRAAGTAAPLDLPDIVVRARAGERTAGAVFAEAGRYIGWALAGLVNTLNPDAIVLGGGVLAAGDLVLVPLQEELAGHTLGPARGALSVVPAALGVDAGLVGAAILAMREFDLEDTSTAITAPREDSR